MLPQILSYIRENDLIHPGDRVGIAVSGGADSVALLRAMLELVPELGIVLGVVHLHHGIRAEADQDETFVQELAGAHDVEFFVEHADVPQYSREKNVGLEVAGRELRYRFFRRLMAEKHFDRIATAHTLDDQAETVLLRLIRGTGSRGMGGIHPKAAISGQGAIIRPALGIRREALRAYLGSIQQDWREDVSNQSLDFTRNRVRHELLPLLERGFNPNIANTLAEASIHARDEEEYWSELVENALRSVQISTEAGSFQLSVSEFLEMHPAVQRRLLRAAAERAGVALRVHNVEDLLRLIAREQEISGSNLNLSLPVGWSASVRSGVLSITKERRLVPIDYEYQLGLPGKVYVPELRATFEALISPARDETRVYNSGHRLNRGLLTPSLIVRNWRPGDRFWPAHTKSPKKVKELLQERRIVQPERALWPVIATVSGQLVWMRGFSVAADFAAADDARSVAVIEELPAL